MSVDFVNAVNRYLRFARTRPGGRLWMLIAGVVLVDAVGMWRTGMTVAIAGLVQVVSGVSLLIGIAFFYAMTRRSDSLMCAANSAAHFLSFCAAGAVLSYLVATTRVPLTDAMLLRIDDALGFRWDAWTAWVHGRPFVHTLLMVAYGAALPETLLCLLYLATRQAADEFVCLIIVTGLITVAVSGVVPALGHLVAGAPASHVLALRAGAMSEIPLRKPEGLITFPSFHTALALVVAYALRLTWFRWPIVGVTGLILLSVPTEGGHYLVDMIAGGLVFLVAVSVTCRIVPIGATTYGSQLQ